MEIIKNNHKLLVKLMKTLLSVTIITAVFCDSVNADCYAAYYINSGCSACGAPVYNSEQKDNCSQHHKRQYSIKFCSNCKNVVSKSAEYYKRGYVDYNCLAYALGKNAPCSWEWPVKWGSGPTVEEFIYYIIDKGYSYANQAGIAYGKNIIYVYAENGRVKHFARKYTLDGKELSGYTTISKWGKASLYKTKSINPYTDTSGYGKMVLVCYK